MHARVAKEELAILLPNTMSQYAQFDREFGQPAPSGFFGRLHSAWRWLIEFPRRRAVLDELNMLSDHELSDIGLTRADLPRVFDPSFAADHEASRSAVEHERAFAA